MERGGHRSRGFHRVLENPAVFEHVMRWLGGPRECKRFVEELVRPEWGARVLDAGCGTGTLLDALPPHVRYVGFDTNGAYIERARRKYGERGTFVCTRAGDDRYGIGGSFDVVVARGLLHHVEDAEADRFLENASRLLRPGGVFVSIDPTLHKGQSMVARLLVSLDRGRCVRTPEAYRRLLDRHFKQVDERVATDLLTVPYSHYLARACSTSAR
jgi:SAM-dependent methyltransferase